MLNACVHRSFIRTTAYTEFFFQSSSLFTWAPLLLWAFKNFAAHPALRTNVNAFQMTEESVALLRGCERNLNRRVNSRSKKMSQETKMLRKGAVHWETIMSTIKTRKKGSIHSTANLSSVLTTPSISWI